MSTVPKPPPPKSAAPAKQETPKRETRISRGTKIGPQKVVEYGPGGVGKSELAANAAKVGLRPIFIDLEDGTKWLDVARIDDCVTFEDVRGVLNPSSDALDEFDLVVVDSMTKLEELASNYVVRNIPHEKREVKISSIEDYGFGKGMTHIYDAILLILGDLDGLVRRGKSVCLICHECVATVPNPNGDDWIRYEPRLQSPQSGKSSVRLRVKEWSDHLVFVNYDKVVEDGKATGHGSRTIYPFELPSHMAKSRSLSESIVYEKGSAELWNQLFKKG